MHLYEKLEQRTQYLFFVEIPGLKEANK